MQQKLLFLIALILFTLESDYLDSFDKDLGILQIRDISCQPTQTFSTALVQSELGVARQFMVLIVMKRSAMKLECRRISKLSAYFSSLLLKSANKKM